jgi:hypothetical protein
MKHTAKLGIVDTMAQAIAATGFDKKVVQWAKKKGCDAFLKGSRVDCDRLKAWVAVNGEKLKESQEVTKEEADIRLKLARAEKAEYELAILKREYLPAVEVEEKASQIARIVSAKMTSGYVVEMPPKVAGLSEIEVREHSKAITASILKDLNDRLTWYKVPVES